MTSPLEEAWSKEINGWLSSWDGWRRFRYEQATPRLLATIAADFTQYAKRRAEAPNRYELGDCDYPRGEMPTNWHIEAKVDTAGVVKLSLVWDREPVVIKLPLDLPNTKLALAEYDAGAPTRSAVWEAISCNADVEVAQAFEALALRKVRLAFYEDTKDRNTFDNCMLADLHTLRMWCGLLCCGDREVT